MRFQLMNLHYTVPNNDTWWLKLGKKASIYYHEILPFESAYVIDPKLVSLTF